MRLLRVALWSLAALGLPAFASSGDRLPSFQGCVSECSESICAYPYALPLTLRLTRWSCVDDCKYGCMHKETTTAIMLGRQVHQYYGKWPFWRFLGMQEPASVVFSLLNFWVHYNGGKYLSSRLRRDHPMQGYYSAYAKIGMNAWVWSAVFHTRDKPLTERLDYFSAGLLILYSLYVAVIRVFRLYRPPRLYLQQNLQDYSPSKWLPPRHILLQIWSALCSLCFLAHVIYLSVIPRFDYSYNIIANVIVGTLHNAVWSAYSIRSLRFKRFDYQPISYMPSYSWIPAALALTTTLATLLELGDFPPWGRVIDAHSLWHLSTVPIGYAWYRFIAMDTSDPGWHSGSSRSLRD